MTGEVGYIYTLHFERRIGLPGRAGALHYTGWARNLDARLHCHELGNGHGASLTAYAVAQGIAWHVVDVRRGTRDDERHLKNNGHHERRCGICKEQAAIQAELDAVRAQLVVEAAEQILLEQADATA